MKSYNLKFKGFDSLREFIEDKKIHRYENILIQIFTGINEINFIKRLVNNIKDTIPNAKIIGTTTSGEILDNKVYKNSTILSFSIFEKTKVNTYYSKFNSNSYLMGQNLTKQFSGENIKVAICFSDGLRTNGDELLRSFNDYDKNLIISGGLAGDNSEFDNTIVFTENCLDDCGAVVATLDNKELIVSTKARFGWSSIGKTMTITKADKNLVYEIDGASAVNIYKKYLGEEIAKNLPKIGIEFPLIIKRGSMKISRAVIAKGEGGSLYFAGNLNVGDKVTLGYGNVDEILNCSYDFINNDTTLKSEAIFIYSCMARLQLLQESISAEILPLSKIAPVSGFFTYGEFYKDLKSYSNEMLNQTMTILSLSENLKGAKKVIDFSTYSSNSNLTLKALSNLILQTSKELEYANRALQKRVAHEVKENLSKDILLKKQSKMAQMGEMLSIIAHQWRQPLSAISSTLLSLEVKLKSNKFDFEKREDRREFLKLLEEKHSNIFYYLEGLSDTIEDFRNFFKINRKRDKVTINEPIDKALFIMKSTFSSRKIDVQLSYKSRGYIYVYKNEIAQVILNILKNSQDNFDEKKVKNPTINIETNESENEYIITICDNGGGIDKRILPYIFDLYFSTKDNKNGTGLGLYISKVIIEEHNRGKIRAFNRDNGVCFEIKLQKNVSKNIMGI